MNQKKLDLIEKLKLENRDKPLIFVHTPKCGGTYVRSILKDLNIKNKGHHVATMNEGIHFTVIRHPVDRFESLLNYRLGRRGPREDWPKSLYSLYGSDTRTLNAIVDHMSDVEITSFMPYRSLTYWTQNVDICITIDELKEFLQLFGYTYDDHTPKNVSIKTRGMLNDKNRERIKHLYRNDMTLFNFWSV